VLLERWGYLMVLVSSDWRLTQLADFRYPALVVKTHLSWLAQIC
jgi:hypothetical protein